MMAARTPEPAAEAAHFLLVRWQGAETWSSTSFPPPRKAWRPATSLGDSSGGSAPLADVFQPATGHGYPTLGKRLAVAQKLRPSGWLPGARTT